MPPTSKKLTGHIGFGLCVRLDECILVCHFLSTIDMYVFFFPYVSRHISRLVQNGLVLHPELSGESKHTRNLDTKSPENVQKCPECVQTL